MAAVFMLLLSVSAFATTQLQDIRVWHSPDRSRVVLDFSADPKYKTFFLDNPARFVVDAEQSISKAKVPPPSNNGQFLRGFRLGVPKAGVTRLVLDLKKSVQVTTSLLKPTAGFNYRLVFDLRAKPVGQSPVSPAKVTKPPEASPAQIKPPQFMMRGPLIVAIDAGHGGEDSGARGKRSKEKVIVLAIAKRLKRKIDAQPNMQAFLTREGDYFVPLRKRINLARTKGSHPADLFISIHADGFRNPAARGSSVYTLSSRGASSEEARWLADKENAADLAGGVSISDREPTLAGVLLDMSMNNTNHESILFANAVLSELKKVGKVHSRNVEKAGFVVLKSPDIPSILVETAFITNPREEALLRSKKHQEKLASAMMSGVRNFVRKSPTLSARMAL